MKNEKKRKTQMIIMSLITIAFSMVIGGYLGFTLIEEENVIGRDLQLFELIGVILVTMLLFLIASVLQIVNHESGHMVMGLLTGYEFASIRFFNFVIIKIDGKLRFKKYSLAGTAGQNIMIPKSTDEDSIPYFWYNAGGITFDLIAFVVFMILSVVLKKGLFSFFTTCMSLLSISSAICNGIPFSELGNDGSNIYLLSKNEYARKAVINSLKIVNELTQDKSMEEIPTYLFDFDESQKMDNIHVTGQAVQSFEYTYLMGDYEKAYQIGTLIQNEAQSIHIMHNSFLSIEMIFVMTMLKREKEEITKLFHDKEKELKKAAMDSNLTYNRCCYGYYCLVEKDEKKAQDSLKKFEKVAKTHPYIGEIKAERKLIAKIDELKKEETDGTN